MFRTISWLLLLDYWSGDKMLVNWIFLNAITYLESIEFVAQILFLIQELLKSVCQNNVGIVKATVHFVEMLVLVLVIYIIVVLGAVVLIFVRLFHFVPPLLVKLHERHWSIILLLSFFLLPLFLVSFIFAFFIGLLGILIIIIILLFLTVNTTIILIDIQDIGLTIRIISYLLRWLNIQLAILFGVTSFNLMLCILIFLKLFCFLCVWLWVN